MNREIVIGFVREHEEVCIYKPLARAIQAKRPCSFCQNVNRDCLLLITCMREARKTVDVGLALSPASKPESYQPYTTAGFYLFRQDRSTESENIRTIFDTAFQKGYESVIFVAHGSPNIPLEYLEYALSELRNGKQIILGPTLNGKFYLIGLKKWAYECLREEDIFNDIDFDSVDERDRIIDRIRTSCSACTLLPEWYVIKSIDDLRKMYDDSVNGRGWKARWTTCLVDDII